MAAGKRSRMATTSLMAIDAASYPAAKFLGTSDEVSTCDCCGRQGLKSTVALLLAGSDEPVYYGATCAAHALRRTVKEIRSSAKAADRAAWAIRAAADQIRARAEDARWQAFLDAGDPAHARSYMGGPDRFRQIEALGGHTAARAAYLATIATPGEPS